MQLAASLFFSFALLGALHVMFALIKSHGARIVSALNGEGGAEVRPVVTIMMPRGARLRDARRVSPPVALPLAA